MAFGNGPRGQLAKLMLPRTNRKGTALEEQGGESICKPEEVESEDEHPVPLVLTHRLNVGASSVEPQDGPPSVPMDAMGMPDFHLASPSPKGQNCQKKFFDDTKEHPWMLENRLKGLFNNFRPIKSQAFDLSGIRNSPKRKGSSSSKRSLVPSLHSPRNPKDVDERTHLILDAAIADEWSERQLAFDLESVVEDTSSSLMWMIHSDDDEDVTLSSPPPESSSRSLTIDTDFESDLDPPVARRRHRRHHSRRRLLQYSPKLATVYEEEDEDSSRTCDTGCFSFEEDSLVGEITTEIEEL